MIMNNLNWIKKECPYMLLYDLIFVRITMMIVKIFSANGFVKQKKIAC
tara:strand:- start:541 stop:684 length:144 start_codon:yes stop_codon:yes gene_type:complete